MMDPWSTDNLQMYPIKGRMWCLAAPHEVHVPDGPRITIPAHFASDLSSVPRPLWFWMPPHGPYTAAAILHDWLYASGLYSRRQADEWFYQHMIDSGVRRSLASVKYQAVRWFGRWAWNRHRNTD